MLLLYIYIIVLSFGNDIRWLEMIFMFLFHILGLISMLNFYCMLYSFYFVGFYPSQCDQWGDCKFVT